MWQIWQWGNQAFWKPIFLRSTLWQLAIANFPFICGNIPSTHVYGVYISLIIRYATSYSYYPDFVYRFRLLSNILLEQGYVATRIKSSLQTFYGYHHKLVDRYALSAPWKLLWSTCHSFAYLYRLPQTTFLWETRQMFLEKHRTVHLVHAFLFLVESECLIYFSFFISFIFVMLCFFVVYVCFPCLVFDSVLHYFDFRKNLFHLVTVLPCHGNLKNKLEIKTTLCFESAEDLRISLYKRDFNFITRHRSVKSWEDKSF